ncbi:MAG: DUF2341 domain-containing protein [Planctomycetaceae bacterium]
MLTALLRWMNQSRTDQRSSLAEAPRLHQSSGRAYSRFHKTLLSPWFRQLWPESPAGRALSLDVFEDRLLFSAAPAPMPAPAEVVVVAQVDAAAAPSVESEAASTDSIAEGARAAAEENQAADTAAEQNLTNEVHEDVGATLIVVDSTVDGYEELLEKLSSYQSGPTVLLVLDQQRDGIEQITERLEKLGETKAIHIISHGDEAGLHLGSTWLSADTISLQASSLTQWQALLSADADLLLYGCDLAAGASGQQFLQSLSVLTGADVAASTNATGAANLGGDWTLEYQFGSLQTASLAEQVSLFDWQGLLTTNTYQQGSGGYLDAADTSVEAGDPDSTGGTALQVTVGGPTSQTGLIKFQSLFGDGPGQIPYGSTITSASLRLNVVTGTAADSTIGLYRVLGTSWTEAATWNSLDGGLTRDGVGVSTVADAVITNTTSTGLLTIAGLQESLQAWSDGEANNGWALFGDSTTAWAFTSADGESTSLRPMLIVDYTPPANAAVELRSTNEIRVNPVTSGVQSTTTNSRNAHDSVGMDANGNYVVVWTSDSGDGSGAAVYAQRYNARGVAQGSVFRVNQSTSGNQQWASVAVNADGQFVVTWTSQWQDGWGQGVYARVFDAMGVGGDEFQVNTTTWGDQMASAIGVSADGSFVIAWEGNGPGDSSGVFAQRFDANGTKDGSEFRVNSITSNSQTDVAVAVSRDGQFMVVWDDSLGTRGRRFNASGTAVDLLDLLIHVDTTSGNADVAATGDGDYHIVWRTTGGGDGSGRGLWQLHLGASDLIPGTPVQVTASTVNDQTEPSITSAANGDYLITWQGAGPGDNAGVFARKFTRDGTPVGTEFQLNDTSAGSQVSVSGAMLNLENFVTVWSGSGTGDTTGIYTRAIGTLDNQSSLLFTTNDNVNSSGISALPSWTTGDVLAIGEPNLTLGENTSGKVWTVGNINAVANDGNVKIKGLDVIQHDVLVAAGTKQIQLYAGDVLFSVEGSETLAGLSVQSDDILVFRPSAPWNYANGTILMLFDGLLSVDGGAIESPSDFDLVDRDTQMGDITLHAGDLIVASQASGESVIQLFHATTSGSGTTSGTVSTILDGSEIGLGSEEIAGLHFVERDMRMGGMTLLSGDLLVSTINDTTIGSNSLLVTRNDVARLTVTQTSVNGAANAVASIAVDGSDVSLDTSGETIRALAMVHVGTHPAANDETITLSEDVTFSSQSRWDLANWDSRMRLTFDNATRAENLTDFPILVTLDTNRFDYSLAQANGADIRFVDTDGTVLDYEIETWNPNGQSAIWVKVPRIDASSGSDSIWMYYGNAAASDAQNPTGVWSNGYVGVWHLSGNPSEAMAIQDSSSSQVDGTSIGMDASNQVNGPIGGALKFDGVSEYIRLNSTGTDPTAVDPSQLTIEAWAQSLGDTGTAERIVNRRNIVGTAIYESYGLATSSGDRSRLVNSTGTPDLVGTEGTLPEDRWRYVTGVLADGNSSLYVDGVLNATQSGVNSFGSSDATITIGAGEMGLTSTISQYWKGGVDEVRLSNVARSAAWTSAQYASMIDAIITYGDRQTHSGLLDNDTSPTNSPLTVSRVDVSGLAGVAAATVTDDGRITITPLTQSLAAGETLSRQIAYTVMDENGNSDLATATIVIEGANDAPVINDANAALTLTSIMEDAAMTGDTVEAILESAGGSLIRDVDHHAVQGIAVTSADQTHGQWQYSLDGTTWLDLSGLSDSNATLFDTSARIRFVPAADFSGVAGGLTFRAWDQTTGTSGQTGVDTTVAGGRTAFSLLTATASIQVQSANDTPTVGTNTGTTVAEGAAVVLSGSQLSATDTDNTPGNLVYSVTTSPAHGYLERVGSPGVSVTTFTQADIDSQEIRYVHDGGESVADAFTFSLADGQATVEGTFEITVTPVNDAPVVSTSLGLTVAEGDSGVILGTSLAAADPDNETSQLVYTLTSAPQHGWLEDISDPGVSITTFTQAQLDLQQIRYVHDGSESTSDLLSFLLSDGAESVSGSFEIAIDPVNDAPVVVGSLISVIEGQAVTLGANHLRATDAEGDSVTYTVSDVTHGRFVNQTTGLDVTTFTQSELNDGVIAYIHDGGDSPPTANVSVSDSQLQSSPTSIQFSVTPVNDPPVIPPAVFQVPENAENGTIVGTVTIDDPDVDDHHTFSLLDGPSSEYFTIDAETGEIRVADSQGLNYEAQSLHELVVQVVDAAGVVAQGTVQIQLVDVKEAPIALGLSDVQGVEDHPIAVIDLRPGWTDPDADELTYQVLSMSNPDLIASASISPDGQLTLVAAPDATGQTQITLQATDADGLTATTTLTVTLSPVNDRPVANSDTWPEFISTATTIDPATLLANDYDVDSTQLNVVIKKLPKHGTLKTNADGTYTYTPWGGYTGIDTFQYAITDGVLLSQNAVVRLNLVALAPSPSQSQTSNGDSASNTSNTASSNANTPDASNSPANRPTGANAPGILASNAPPPNNASTSSHGSENSSMVSPIPSTTSLEDVGQLSFHRARPQTDANNPFDRGRSAHEVIRAGTRSQSRDLSPMDHAESDSFLSRLSSADVATRVSPSLILGLQANQVAFEQVKESLQPALANQLVFEVPALAGASLSVGYVVWMLRGGVLITSLLAQMPAWRIVDPLVVLESLDKSDEDDESIGSLVEQGQSEHECAV